MQPNDAYAPDIRSFYGFRFDQIPPLNQLLETEKPTGCTKSLDDAPEWVRGVWTGVKLVAQKCGIRLLIVEIAVIQDPRSQDGGERHFVSNIVCGAEPDVPAETHPVLDAYLSMFPLVDTLGSSLHDPSFHSRKYYVHIPTSGAVPNVKQQSDSPRFSYTHKKVPVASGKYAKSGLPIGEHCKKFFSHFLKTLGDNRRLFDRMEYIAIPFQRPGLCDDNSSDTTRKFPLEPGGAMFLFVEPTETDPDKKSQNIDLFVTRMRLVINEACKKESSRSLDQRTAESVTHKTMLATYSGIGHALRTYVEATGYAGSANEIRRALSGGSLPNDIRQILQRALRSLNFFRDAEGLGSLMRLHGWVKERSVNPRWSLAEKIFRCYESSEIEAIRRGDMTDKVLKGYFKLVEAQASLLAQKDDVRFRIKAPELGADCTLIIQPGDGDCHNHLTTLELPPLKAVGEQAAVLLAVSVGLLEPLRNASIALQDEMHRRAVQDEIRYLSPTQGGRPPDDVPKQPNAMVEVIIRSNHEVCQIYIGNPLFGRRKPTLEGMSGVMLVNSLLEEIRLGRIRLSTAVEAESQPHLHQGEQAEDYLWVCVESHPLKLYDFAKASEEQGKYP